MTQLPDIKKLRAGIDTISNPVIQDKKISLSILRLDSIHPEISGNKFFKLYYFLRRAIAERKKIITFGGAYSNHLYATAAACKYHGVSCTGIVRGEEPKVLSHTLLFCRKMGMELKFISREQYGGKTEIHFRSQLESAFGEHVLVPEGGYSEEGINGAALISALYDSTYSHICCATGTATTLAGLIKSSHASQQIMGFSVLKDEGLLKTLNDLHSPSQYKNYSLIDEYHFGGYAKKTTELISFMNQLYTENKIPTDFVYTGKLMFGVFDLIKKGHFPQNSKLLCVHTGGLQGNSSLAPGTLNF